MAELKTPAVFFDRDGTVMEDANYCSDPGKVRAFAGVSDSLRKLKTSGYKLIMITNQSGIGRGYFTHRQYEAVHAELLRQLGQDLIDATYVCPDPPDVASACRKPAPGMILQGAREHEVDLSRSICVGDKEIDVQCAHNAGIKAIRVRTGFDPDATHSSADWIASNFGEATDIILTQFAR